MGPPPSEPGADSTGPPDRQTLRLLERQLAADELVAEVAFDPDPYEPRLLRATLDRDSYPDSVTAVRLDVRWFTTGDFSIHYVESRGDDRWECRWDRHPNAHNARVHFHEPPACATVTDLDLSSLHPLDVYATAFEAVERRIRSLW
ncbi:hypothetical protein GCM10027435_20900 [Haloparvum alkalitolerans]|uniref:hypothetical protein n=1 Tax=Haloparvum alkalitolerans TaxID=1042953 RepID=UPI003CF563C3